MTEEKKAEEIKETEVKPTIEEQAFSVVEQATATYRGTRQEHQAIVQSLVVLKGLVNGALDVIAKEAAEQKRKMSCPANIDNSDVRDAPYHGQPEGK